MSDLYATYSRIMLQSKASRERVALENAGLCFVYDSSTVTTTTKKMGRKPQSPVIVTNDATKRLIPCRVLSATEYYATCVPLLAITKRDDDAPLPKGAYFVYDHLSWTKRAARDENGRTIYNRVSSPIERLVLDNDNASHLSIVEHDDAPAEVTFMQKEQALKRHTKTMLYVRRYAGMEVKDSEAEPTLLPFEVTIANVQPASYDECFFALVGRQPEQNEYNPALIP